MTCFSVFKPLFSVNILFIIHTIYFVMQIYNTDTIQTQMQGSNEEDFIDYSPVPDSPPQEYVSPRVITPTMRSDQSQVFPSQYRFWQHPQRGRRQPQHHRPQQRQWRDVQVPEEERRIFKGKWGRLCRTQSCRHKRQPPPPPPPAAAASGLNQRPRTIAAHGGTRKTLKNRSINRSRKCKRTRRK